MAKRISKQINTQYIPTIVGGYPVYAYGGKIYYADGGGLNMEDLTASSPSTDLGGMVAGQVSDMFGTGKGGSAASGALKGAASGAELGPLGMGIGALVGGATGFFKGKANEEAERQAERQQLKQFNQGLAANLPATPQYTPTFAMGGKINPLELSKGIKEEMEHTTSKKESKKIAIDHLKEHPNYYSKLKKAGLAESYANGGQKINPQGGTGYIKPYDESLKGAYGRLRGKFKEVIPESWRTLLPGVSDVEDLALLKEAYGPQGTTFDKIISTAGLALPVVGTRALKTISLDKLPKKVFRGIESSNIEKIRPEELINPTKGGIYSPNAFTSSNKAISESFSTPNPVVGTKGMLNTYEVKRPFAAVTDDEADKYLKKHFKGRSYTEEEAASALRKEGIEAVYEDMLGEYQYQFLNNDLLNLSKSELKTANPDFSINKKQIRANGGTIDMFSSYMNKPVSERLVEFKNGGSHESNPNSGIPVGPNALTEEGELMYTTKSGEKYVFTDRF